MKKNTIKHSTLILGASSILMLTGCAEKYNPSPKALDVAPTLAKMNENYNMKFNIKKGESFKDFIVKMQKASPNIIIVDKTTSEIIFDKTISDISPEELRQYIKISFDKSISFRKYSEKLFTIEETEDKNKALKVKEKEDKEKTEPIPDIKIKVNGEFSYDELFNTLRDQNINIIIDIYKKDSKEAFDSTKKAPEFVGKLSDFLDLVSAKERLFVVKEKGNTIRLKDVKTISYDLKLPNVKMTPALSTNGFNTAVTLQSATQTNSSSGTTNTLNNSTYNNNNNAMHTTQPITPSTNNSTTGSNANSVTPLDSLKTQFDDMLKDKATYSVNPSNGTLSITGDYEALNTADKLIKDFHDIYDHAIKIELHVYEVTLNNKNSFGIDYNFLQNELVGGSVKAIGSLTTGLSLTPSSVAAFSGNNGTVLETNGNVQQTEGLIFKSLNLFGKTSVITKPTLGTINNLPVKLDIINSKDYVYSINQGTNSVTGSSTTSTSGSTTPDIRTLTTGYSLIVHPKMEDDYIKLAIKSVSSVNNGFESYDYYTSGTSSDTNGSTAQSIKNTIKLKDISAREFDETVKIKEGEIAIIGGYMYEEQTSLKDGLPLTTEEDGKYDAITAAKERKTNKVEIVITVSAKVI
jgi:general secretion pathway protein D